MPAFRDVGAENRETLAMLDLPPGTAVLEIGCGTGRFARAAAAEGFSVTAIDVSAVMLEYLRHRVIEEGLAGIETQHAGFLTMDFSPARFDAVVSGAALHHLPDAWKLVAVRNVARILKPRGQFVLRDAIFTLDDFATPEECFEQFACAFPNMRIEAARHVAQEFSTYDWIMEGLLTRAGFEIVEKRVPGKNFVIYHCRKS
jgi:putative AdoMet-dependent methyltransferase